MVDTTTMDAHLTMNRHSFWYTLYTCICVLYCPKIYETPSIWPIFCNSDIAITSYLEKWIHFNFLFPCSSFDESDSACCVPFWSRNNLLDWLFKVTVEPWHIYGQIIEGRNHIVSLVSQIEAPSIARKLVS